MGRPQIRRPHRRHHAAHRRERRGEVRHHHGLLRRRLQAELGRRRRHHLRQVRRWCCFSFLGLLGRQSRGAYDLNNSSSTCFSHTKEQLLACVKKGKCCCWEEVAGRYERERIQEGVLVCVWTDRGSAFFWRVLALFVFVGWTVLSTTTRKVQDLHG